MVSRSLEDTCSDCEAEQNIDPNLTEKRFDCILDDLIGNLTLTDNEMTIKNRKDRPKHEVADRKDTELPGTSATNHYSYNYIVNQILQSQSHSDTVNHQQAKQTRVKSRSPLNQSINSLAEQENFVKKSSKTSKRPHGHHYIEKQRGAKLSPEFMNKSKPENNSEDEYEDSPEAKKVSTEPDDLGVSSFAKLLMDKKGWQLTQVGSDGACLFRSVAHQIFGDEEKHDVIRKQVCDYMLKNKEHFSPYITEDFEHYISRKQHPNCHGNHVEIQAIAELYNRPVEIYRDNIEPVNVFHSEYQNGMPIRLSYHGHVHYNSIVDPLNPSFGLGLAEPQLIEKAVSESEKALIEEAMLRDKLNETEQSEIEKCIEEQVIRESYYESLRGTREVAVQENIASSSNSHLLAQACSFPPNYCPDDIPSSSKASSSQHISGSTSPYRQDKSNYSDRLASRQNCSDKLNLQSTCDAAVLRNIPEEMLDMDEDAIMEMILEQSRHEYLHTLSNQKPPTLSSKPALGKTSNLHSVQSDTSERSSTSKEKKDS